MISGFSGANSKLPDFSDVALGVGVLVGFALPLPPPVPDAVPEVLSVSEPVE